MTAPEAAIRIRGLSKSFAGQPLYRDFDLDIPKHQISTIVGPNGCGKSTLLRALWRLCPDAGEVLPLPCDGHR